MANDYYTRQGSYTKGTLARGDVVKSDFDALVTAFDLAQTNINRAIKLPNEGSPQTDFEFTENAASRAGKVIGFDSLGALELQTGVGDWEGTWATSTAYTLRDVVVDGAAGANTENIYICIVANTSGTWSTDLAAAKWELMVDVEEARNWAKKTDGIVDSTDYSSKAYAIGGTGVTTTSGKGASKEWAVASGLVDTASYSSKEYAQGTAASTGGSAKDYAQKTDGGVSGATSNHSSKAWAVGGTGVTTTASAGAAKEWATGVLVDTSEYSSKEYAVGTTVAAGSAKDWAMQASGTVDGTSYSAKYSADASATSATASASSATSSASSATAGASSATASASSATASASSATAAAASYDAFDDRYLGSKSSDPTVDNDGNTLLDGALYWNTTNNVLMVYDLGGTTWNRTTPTTTEQGHINTVSGIAANVTTVAGISSDVTAVAGKATEVGLLGVAAVITDMGILGTADVVTDMNVLATADVVTDMNTLGTADVVTDMNVLATADVVSDMNTLATADIVTDMNLLGTSANVAAMALLGTTDAISDMNTLGVADVVTDLNTLGTADVVVDMNTLGTAANVTAMDTVATNIVGVNSFAERYRVDSADPTTSLDEGDLAYNTTANALKYYDGTSWNAITSNTDVKVSVSANDTTPGYLNGKLVAGSLITLTENNDGGNETLTLTSNSDPAGTAVAMAIALGG